VIRVPDAREDPTGFAQAVAEGALRASARVVLPGTEGGLLALAAHAELFGPELALGVCSPATTASATDKVTALADAAAVGVDVLPARVLGAEGPAGTDELSYPVVVKPLRSELPVDGQLRRYETRLAEDREALIVALAALPDGVGIVQQHMEGRRLTVNGLAWEGDVVAEVHAVGVRTWPADCGAVTYAETIDPHPLLAENARALMARLGWSGVFNLQFMESGGGLFLVEVNPRLHTSLGLAIAAGINLPAIWVRALLGEPLEVPDYAVGVRFRTEDDVRSLAHQFRSGARLAALSGLLPQRRTTHAVVSLSDPRPGLSYLRDLPRRMRPAKGFPARAPG
jgi:predicted ATP-grasp superfamily ATP-dependent carboligase